MDPVAKALVDIARICGSLSTEDRVEVLEGLARIYRRDSSRPMPAAEVSAETSAENARRLKENERKKAAYRAEKLRGESGNLRGESAEVSAENLRTLRGESRAVQGSGSLSESGSGDLLSPSRQIQRGESPFTAREPARESGSLPAPVVHAGLPADLLACVEAYREGVSRGAGHPFAPPRAQWDDLVEVIRVHGCDEAGPFTGEVRLAWLRHDGEQFARFVSRMATAQKDKERWNLNPRAFARWKNLAAENAAIAREAAQ